MSFQTKLDLSQQSRIPTGQTADWQGSVNIGETLKIGGFEIDPRSPFLGSTLLFDGFTQSYKSGKVIGNTGIATGYDGDNLIISFTGSSTTVGPRLQSINNLATDGIMVNYGTDVTTVSLSGSSDFTLFNPSGILGANIELSLSNTGVSGGTYGSSTIIPSITVDNKGRVLGISGNSINVVTYLSGLTDVYMFQPIPNNSILMYDNNVDLWFNGSVAQSLGYTPVSEARTLTINGESYDLTADRVWTIDALPSQSGNTGYFLTTNGTSASWAAIPSYSGTTNRITVSAGVIDISSAYVGQSSITTVGTLTSGALGSGFTAIADAQIASAATWNAKFSTPTGLTTNYLTSWDGVKLINSPIAKNATLGVIFDCLDTSGNLTQIGFKNTAGTTISSSIVVQTANNWITLNGGIVILQATGASFQCRSDGYNRHDASYHEFLQSGTRNARLDNNGLSLGTGSINSATQLDLQSTTKGLGLNLIAGDLGTTRNGLVWYDTIANQFKGVQNGGVVSLLGGALTTDLYPYWNGTSLVNGIIKRSVFGATFESGTANKYILANPQSTSMAGIDGGNSIWQIGNISGYATFGGVNGTLIMAQATAFINGYVWVTNGINYHANTLHQFTDNSGIVQARLNNSGLALGSSTINSVTQLDLQSTTKGLGLNLVAGNLGTTRNGLVWYDTITASFKGIQGSTVVSFATTGTLGSYVDFTSTQTITGQKSFTLNGGNSNAGTGTGTTITNLDCSNFIRLGRTYLSVAGTSVSLGVSSGHNNISYTTIVGANSGNWTFTGQYNSLFGDNNAPGLTSGTVVTAVGSGAVGQLTSGNYITALGWGSAYGVTTATNCVYLGHGSGRALGNQSHRLAIDAETFGKTFPFIYGEFDNGILAFNINRLGVGTKTPNAVCQVDLASTTLGLGLPLVGFGVLPTASSRMGNMLTSSTGSTSGSTFISNGVDWTKVYTTLTGSTGNVGTATLVGGNVTVFTTKVTANSIIMLTNQQNGLFPGFLFISGRTPGSNFTIGSSDVSDTSIVGWMIIEP